VTPVDRYIDQFADLPFKACLLKELALARFARCLALLHAAARKYAVVPAVFDAIYDEHALIPHDNGHRSDSHLARRRTPAARTPRSPRASACSD